MKLFFSLKLNIEQATEVNAILIILSIKYSMYVIKCDVNYIGVIALVDDRRIRVSSASENHRIFNTRSSANNLI